MELYIDFSNRQRKEKVDDALRGLVKRALTAAFEYEGVTGDAEVSVTFVSDAGIRKYNREYRGIDRATDVLSFPLFDGGDIESAFDGERYQLGDVVLSLERARSQAELYGHSFERETVPLRTFGAASYGLRSRTRRGGRARYAPPPARHNENTRTHRQRMKKDAYT